MHKNFNLHGPGKPKLIRQHFIPKMSKTQVLAGNVKRENHFQDPFNNAQENSGILTSSNPGREVVLPGTSSEYPHLFVWWAPVRDAKHPVICGSRTAPYTFKCTKEKIPRVSKFLTMPSTQHLYSGLLAQGLNKWQS